MWKELLTGVAGLNSNVKINPPATHDDILQVEKKLNLIVPNKLKNLLTEFNGDNWFIFSTKQIVEINCSLRELTCYMPLDFFLFFAGNGCGDYYGYAITGEGIKDWEIYMWDHESDNRIFIANGLEDVIKKYYSDQI